LQRTENPRVGGSIPSPATITSGAQHPRGVKATVKWTARTRKPCLFTLSFLPYGSDPGGLRLVSGYPP